MPKYPIDLMSGLRRATIYSPKSSRRLKKSGPLTEYEEEQISKLTEKIVDDYGGHYMPNFKPYQQFMRECDPDTVSWL